MLIDINNIRRECFLLHCVCSWNYDATKKGHAAVYKSTSLRLHYRSCWFIFPVITRCNDKTSFVVWRALSCFPALSPVRWKTGLLFYTVDALFTLIFFVYDILIQFVVQDCDMSSLLIISLKHVHYHIPHLVYTLANVNLRYSNP